MIGNQQVAGAHVDGFLSDLDFILVGTSILVTAETQAFFGLSLVSVPACNQQLLVNASKDTNISVR